MYEYKINKLFDGYAAICSWGHSLIWLPTEINKQKINK